MIDIPLSDYGEMMKARDAATSRNGHSAYATTKTDVVRFGRRADYEPRPNSYEERIRELEYQLARRDEVSKTNRDLTYAEAELRRLPFKYMDGDTKSVVIEMAREVARRVQQKEPIDAKPLWLPDIAPRTGLAEDTFSKKLHAFPEIWQLERKKAGDPNDPDKTGLFITELGVHGPLISAADLILACIAAVRARPDKPVSDKKSKKPKPVPACPTHGEGEAHRITSEICTESDHAGNPCGELLAEPKQRLVRPKPTMSGLVAEPQEPPPNPAAVAPRQSDQNRQRRDYLTPVPDRHVTPSVKPEVRPTMSVLVGKGICPCCGNPWTAKHPGAQKCGMCSKGECPCSKAVP